MNRCLTFDCTGMGADIGRPILRFLFMPNMSENYAVSLAAHILLNVKTNVETCGGRSTIIALRDDGSLCDFTGHRLAEHAERWSNWMNVEIAKFTLRNTEGTYPEFKDRLVELNMLAYQMRDQWDGVRPNQAKQSNPASTKDGQLPQPPPRDLREETGES